ncbi:kinase-like protein [Patellaria atrata CBS 101060]|uniref:non-specific serine/threonine protein kinase n=1 Tax=Patellaria atrata CBS 101060 TaxID=1346257 RepID=A0A9P4VTN5_9PEZI|nr:kinase-like protein [Patellaria atrata CBS 101060]
MNLNSPKQLVINTNVALFSITDSECISPLTPVPPTPPPPKYAQDPDYLNPELSTNLSRDFVKGFNKSWSGGEGSAELICHRATKQLFILKTLHNSKRVKSDELTGEQKVFEFLGPSEHIVLFVKEYLDTSTAVWNGPQRQFLYGYCDGGDLYEFKDRYEEHNIALPELLVWDLYSQLAGGVAFIHGQGIVHADIKPANIFLASGPGHPVAGVTDKDDHPKGKPYPRVKLGDFGMAFSPPEKCPGYGTPSWQPADPEKPRSMPADVWAVAAVAQFLCVGRGPLTGGAKTEDFSSNSSVVALKLGERSAACKLRKRKWYRETPRKVYNITDPRQLDRPLIGPEGEEFGYSSMLFQMVRRVLQATPSMRATAKDLVVQVESRRLVDRVRTVPAWAMPEAPSPQPWQYEESEVLPYPG